MSTSLWGHGTNHCLGYAQHANGHQKASVTTSQYILYTLIYQQFVTGTNTYKSLFVLHVLHLAFQGLMRITSMHDILWILPPKPTTVYQATLKFIRELFIKNERIQCYYTWVVGSFQKSTPRSLHLVSLQGHRP